MQFILTINQVKALEWGLNAQQALLFAVVYDAPRWADPIYVDGKVFYKLSKSKIVSELPLLTEKPDTAYRMLKALELVEVIELSSTSKITLIHITAKGKEWNTSEKYPSKVGKISEVRSEIFPTDQVTINQVTSNTKSSPPNEHFSVAFEAFWKMYPKKVSKADALKAWGKIKAELVTTIMQALATHVTCEQWVKDDGRFIPNAATWLNGKKWEDEVKPYVAGNQNAGANRPGRPSLVEQVRQANAHLFDDEPPFADDRGWPEFDSIREIDGQVVDADDRAVRPQVDQRARH